MNLKDALKEMAHRAKLSQKRLAEAAGYHTISAIRTPIARGDMKISTLSRLANAAGYDVMLVRRNAIEPELPIRIDAHDKDKGIDIPMR